MFNYLIERNRMLKVKDGVCGIKCNICLFAEHADETPFLEGCVNKIENEHPLQATEIVRKWAEENPVKTYRDVLLEKLPNATTEKNGSIYACRNILFKNQSKYCGNNEDACKCCWNEPYKEEDE